MNVATSATPAHPAVVTILVIDDEAPVREMLRMTLEAEGHRVLLAWNGAEGRVIALRQKPDIIVCDVRMPGMSGHELLTALRSDYHTRQIPFIFLTGCREMQSIRLGMAGGAAEYIVKPFRPGDLDDAISSCQRKLAWFDRPQALRETAARCA